MLLLLLKLLLQIQIDYRKNFEISIELKMNKLIFKTDRGFFYYHQQLIRSYKT